jgi:predicted nuclease of predicted toxin-antitoxin system
MKSVTLRFHLDENVNESIAIGMRHQQLDVTSTHELGMDGLNDDDQLAYCKSEQRVILTSDTDFLKLHGQGMAHEGIIYIQQSIKMKIGQVVKFILNMIQQETPESVKGRVFFI